MKPIITILPKDEGFSPAQFGAIALCVRDFTLHSKYREHITVISGIQSTGFEGINFSPAPSARWYENRTRAYARYCVAMIKQKNSAFAEVHNRPKLLRLIAPKVACKLVLHLHNDPQEMQDARSITERQKLVEICDGIFCVSAYIRARFLEGLSKTVEAKLHVVHNGIAIPSITAQKEKLIVFAGRMTEGKGALLLAEALAIALPNMPDWRAVLIGSNRHSTADHLSAHECATAKALSPVATQTEMLGFLSHEETLAYFARAEIGVIPSLWQEPFGRTAIEAMAYGCALVSSGRGALREVTADAALTLDTLTAHSLADALTTLARNAEARKTLQQNALARVQLFSIAKCAATLDKARSGVLSESMHHAA